MAIKASFYFWSHGFLKASMGFAISTLYFYAFAASDLSLDPESPSRESLDESLEPAGAV